MIDLKKLGYEKEKYGKTEQGVPARVTAVHRERYEVISAQGESFARCRASAYRNCRAADYPTVGDFVELLPAENSDGWILRTLPRQTVFTRTNLHGHAAKFVKNIDEQAVAANFDWVWIVQSLNHNFSLPRLERYLALTRSSGARAMVVLTKRDLDADWRQKAESVRAFCGEVPVALLRHDTVAAMPFLAMMAPVGLIVPSVMLPTTYKLGATKGRVVYIVMLMVMAGVCVLLVNLSKESGAPATLSPLATTAISLAVFIGSWALSVKWFKAREL